MLSMGPSPTWLLKLRTCQPMTLASCWTACTWCCDICEWKRTLYWQSAWTFSLQWPDVMIVNFWWGFHYLAQEPYVMYEESSCVWLLGGGRAPPTTTTSIAEAKIAWHSPSLFTGSLRTTHDQLDAPIWITTWGATIKVAGRAEYLPLTLHVYSSLLCPGASTVRLH